MSRKVFTSLVMVVFWTLALAGGARAGVTNVGTGEPAFTRTLPGSSDTFYFNWANPGTNDSYAVCFVLYKDGTEQNAHDTDCYSRGNGSGVVSRTYTGLLSGHTYTVVAGDEYLQGGFLLDGSITASDATEIDNTNPTEQVSVDGPTALYTNDPVLAVHIDYSDSLSYPFPAANGGVTVDCTQADAACSSGSYDPGCSYAAVWHGLTNHFDCSVTYNGPDGKVFYCADEASAAVADKLDNAAPTSADASWSGWGNGCGYITLDRVGPAVSTTANGQSGTIHVTVGSLVSFSVTATDAGAGPDGVYDWNFGDNTGHGAGATSTHTFTQPGTYSVSATTHDLATTVHSTSPPYYGTGSGNAGSGSVVVVVDPASTAPPAGGGTPAPGGGGSTPPGTGGGTTPPPSGGGGGTGTTPPSPARAAGALHGSLTATLAYSGAKIAALSGRGGTQRKRVGKLSLLAPKRFRFVRHAQIPLTVKTSVRGLLSLTLTHGRHSLAKGTVKFTRVGALGLRLRLPAHPSLGAATLRIHFTQTGKRSPTSRSVRIMLLKKR